MWVTSRTWKSQENKVSPTASKKEGSPDNTDFFIFLEKYKMICMIFYASKFVVICYAGNIKLTQCQ